MGKAATTRGIGAALEKVAFYNSTPLFKQDAIKMHHQLKKSSTSVVLGENKGDETSCINKFCWWNPSENSLPVEFCRNSSIHGLSFIGKPKLHLSERIFWTVAFTLGVVAAIFLIVDVWQRYHQNPVIVAFQAQEVDIDSIPFPSVTICSMNGFPKSEVKRLQKLAHMPGSTKEVRKAREALKYVREICHSQLSFAKDFQYANSRGEEDMSLGWNDTITEDTQNEMMDFLLKYTLPCESLIRLCMFAEKPVDCKTLFKPLITDYGKCCTFNILPVPLLLNQQPQQHEITPTSTEAPKTLKRWSDKEIERWRAWDYDKDGFILANKSQVRPFRQKRAGMPYGLSILVDPNLDDWYCPVSDSEGFRFVLHNPLEVPLVDEFASLIQLNQEIMIELHPSIKTVEDIRDLDREARHCSFPEERQLLFFGPYTSSNCFVECTALVYEKKCNCTYFYMPRTLNTGICNSDPHSTDYKCMAHAKSILLDTLKTQCKHCDSLCEDIEYHFETTTAALQDPLQLWSDPDPEYIKEAPPWAKNKMSILHIFMGSESIVPKVRKRLYGTTDLIANTGGLLGLCLGFSVLSAMEIVYFLTLRIFWHICWNKRARGNKENSRKLSYPASERIIQLNSNQIPLVHQSWVAYNTVPSHHSFIPAALMNKKGL